MKPLKHLFRSASLLAFLASSGLQATTAPAVGLLDHDARRLNSDEIVNLKEAYGGKVILVVNTASKCAFTDQYEGLEALYETYEGKGLVVLGFPSNDFGGQEPGTEKQIQNFCRLTYGIRFPMFAKTSVTKDYADPFFTGLAEAAGRYPKWNFHKYLIDRDGRLVDDYLSSTSPQNNTLIEAIEALL